MEKQPNSFVKKSDGANQYYRFQVFQGEKDESGKLKKSKKVGMAYIKDGQDMYSLRLWTFLWERYFIVPQSKDASKYWVMTREPSKNSKNKFFWNIIGNGNVDAVQGVIELRFDLLSRPIYVSIYPEPSAHAVDLPEPESLERAA